MNILLISYIALMDSNPNGRTMKKLLEGIPSENISLFTVSGYPDKDACRSTYKVTNKDAILSMVPFVSRGGVLPAVDNSETHDNSLDTVGKHSAKKYLLKELCWKIGGWKNKKLKSWLKGQQIDCVIYMYGHTPSLQKFAIYVSNYLNVPLIVYSCENYCMKNYNYLDGKEHSLSFSIYDSSSKKATQALMTKASNLICNTPALGDAFAKMYGLKRYEVVMMTSSIDNCINRDESGTYDKTIVFAGAIGRYRAEALIDIGKCLKEVDDTYELQVYGKSRESAVIEMLINCPYVSYKGFKPYDEIQRIICSAKLNLEVINSDPKTEAHKMYGFSTKFADAIQCKTPFMIYAPIGMVETQFAIENKCAFVATKKEELKNVLKSALFDEEMREIQQKMAEEVNKKYFNKEKNDHIVLSVISEAIKEH